MKQDLAFVPQLFQAVIITLVGREKVDDDIAQVNHQPPAARISFDYCMEIELLFGGLQHGICQAVEHPVT